MELNEVKSLSEQEQQAFNLVQMFSKMKKDGIGLDGTLDINSSTKNNLARTLKKYDSATVDKWLQQPAKFTKELRNLSMFLMQSDTLYYRAVNYLATMPQICPVVIPNDITSPTATMKDNYIEAAKYIDVLNLPHEMVKVFGTLFAEAVFFGLEYQVDESYYIKKLNPDYCMVTSVSDGAYCFHYDMSFFDNDKSGDLLKSYNGIWSGFNKAYQNYKKNKTNYRWVEIPENQSVCFKINESVDHCIPPFVSAFSDLCNIEDYKNLNKISTEQANYQLLGLEMETSTKSDKPNDFKVSTDVAMSFYNMIASGLPSGVGAFITPVPAKPIKFEKRTGDVNQVANATSSLYDSLGLASVLFAGASNAGTLKYSTRVDEAIIFTIYRQIERWINRKLKLAGLDFHVKLLDMTVFNKGELQGELLKLAQMSIPVKAHLAASIGLSPLDMMNSSYLENTILDFETNWKPLASSHTQSVKNGEVGRTTKDDTELSDKGQETRDSDSNANKESDL